VSGLYVSLNNSDTAAVKNLYNSKLNIDVGIIQCKRPGKDPAIAGADQSSSSSSGSNRTRPILVTMSTVDQADEVVMKLLHRQRNSASHPIQQLAMESTSINSSRESKLYLRTKNDANAVRSLIEEAQLQLTKTSSSSTTTTTIKLVPRLL